MYETTRTSLSCASRRVTLKCRLPWAPFSPLTFMTTRPRCGTRHGRHTAIAAGRACGRPACSLVKELGIPCVQVTTLQMGPRPNYNSIIQFIVPMDATFLRYMCSTQLRLELNQVTGFSWSEVGRAQLDLSEVTEDLRLETAGGRPRRRNLKVVGSAGTALGSVTVCICCLPMSFTENVCLSCHKLFKLSAALLQTSSSIAPCGCR